MQIATRTARRETPTPALTWLEYVCSEWPTTHWLLPDSTQERTLALICCTDVQDIPFEVVTHLLHTLLPIEMDCLYKKECASLHLNKYTSFHEVTHLQVDEAVTVRLANLSLKVQLSCTDHRVMEDCISRQPIMHVYLLYSRCKSEAQDFWLKHLAIQGKWATQCPVCGHEYSTCGYTAGTCSCTGTTVILERARLVAAKWQTTFGAEATPRYVCLDVVQRDCHAQLQSYYGPDVSVPNVATPTCPTCTPATTTDSCTHTLHLPDVAHTTLAGMYAHTCHGQLQNTNTATRLLNTYGYVHLLLYSQEQIFHHHALELHGTTTVSARLVLPNSYRDCETRLTF